MFNDWPLCLLILFYLCRYSHIKEAYMIIYLCILISTYACYCFLLKHLDWIAMTVAAIGKGLSSLIREAGGKIQSRVGKRSVRVPIERWGIYCACALMNRAWSRWTSSRAHETQFPRFAGRWKKCVCARAAPNEMPIKSYVAGPGVITLIPWEDEAGEELKPWQLLIESTHFFKKLSQTFRIKEKYEFEILKVL